MTTPLTVQEARKAIRQEIESGTGDQQLLNELVEAEFAAEKALAAPWSPPSPLSLSGVGSTQLTASWGRWLGWALVLALVAYLWSIG